MMCQEGLILFGLSFSQKVHAERTDSGFPRIFLQPQLQNEKKNWKNYLSILAIVNYQTWLDASLP